MTEHVSYPIDFDAYTTEEIEQLASFLSKVEAYHAKGHKRPTAQEMKSAYRTYRSILNNLSEEKRIDRAFERQTGISIYKTMKRIENR